MHRQVDLVNGIFQTVFFKKEILINLFGEDTYFEFCISVMDTISDLPNQNWPLIYLYKARLFNSISSKSELSARSVNGNIQIDYFAINLSILTFICDDFDASILADLFKNIRGYCNRRSNFLSKN